MDAKLKEFIDGLVAQIPTDGTWEPDWVTIALGQHRKLSHPDLEPYQGTNQLWMGLLAMIHELPMTQEGTFTGHIWGGAKTWKDRGFMMRKGTHSLYRPILAYPVSFCDEHDSKCDKTCKVRTHFMRVKLVGLVFHASQVFPLDEDATWPTVGELPEASFDTPQIVDAWTKAGFTFRDVDPTRAYYSHADDYINLPPIEAFSTEDGFKRTLAHEAIHATGHSSRLDRPYGKGFGDPVYAGEELIADIGSALMAPRLGIIGDEPHPDHALYLKHWLAVIQEKPERLYNAAVAANRAADFLVAMADLGEMVAA